MNDVNMVALTGNLTRDPEVRVTAGGTGVLRFGVAASRGRKSQQTGEWEDVPCYVDCVMFGNRAQGLGGVLAKGAKVALQGHLSYDSWEDKQTGQRRSRLELVVDEIVLMSQRDGGAQRRQAPAAPAAGWRDEDLPF